MIAIGGTALVFAMALVMAGMSASFRVEADRMLATIGADAWVVPDGVVGPFTTSSAFEASLAESVADVPGVSTVAPMVVLRQTVTMEDEPTDLTVLGIDWVRLASPSLAGGRGVQRRGEIVADTTLGASVGSPISIGGRRFTVVGSVDGLTLMGGIPVAFMGTADAQSIGFGGQPLISSIAVRGTPIATPDGFTSLDGTAARADLMRPLAKGIQAIDSVQILLWFVAAIIIAAVIYLSALERVRDFAVLKAVGASSSRLFGSLCLQSVIISLVAAIIAFGISLALAPTFALPIQIPVAAFALLPVVALLVGIGASLSGLRRAIGVDPARAFGSA